MTTLRNFQDVELEVKRTNLEVERLLTDVRLILDRINHIRISDVSTVLPSLVTDHGILSGLGDDDHLQYILVSGTRPFTGDQSHGDFNISNVGDIGLDSITADASIITINNDTTFLGTLTIPDFVYHAGDPDTLINFSDDQIILQAGGKYMLILTEAGQDLITLGPGSGDVDVDFNGDMFLRGSDGRFAVGPGFTSPDGLIHIHTATAGTVTAAAAADELVLENNGNAGMHILNPDTSISSIYMGSPGDYLGAAIAWTYGAAGATSLMSVGTSSVLGQLSLQTGSGLEAIRIDASQQVGIGVIPTVELEVLGTITGTTITGANVTSGVDPGHTHTGASLSTIDISDDTNLVGGSGITLNDDTLDLDINSLAVATIAAGDFVPFWDITVTADNKKITFANLEGTIDHGNIAGTGDDDHSQYALLAGRAGGQTLIGGTASGQDLTLQSTAHATKGSILFGVSAYDEVNDRLGVGIATPTLGRLHVLDDNTGVYSSDMGSAIPDSHGILIDNAFSGDVNNNYTGILLRTGGDSSGVMTGFIGVVDEGGIGEFTGRMVFGTRNGSGNILERMAIDEAGRVGVGTSSPQTLINMSSALTGGAGAHANQAILRLTQEADTNYNIDDIHSEIQFYTNDPGSSFPGIQAYIRCITTRADGITFPDAGLVFGTSNGGAPAIDRMRIDEVGDVEIGNTGGSGRLYSYVNTSSKYAAHFKNDQSSSGHGVLIETDGTADGTYALRVDTAALANALIVKGDGDIGFGILNPDGTVHIHTANAGSVTANAGADELVLENSTSSGMSILAPDASTSQIIFGSPSDNSGATVAWNYNAKTFTLGSQTASGEIIMVTAAGTETMRLDSSQNVGIRTPDQFGSGTGVLGVKDAGVNPSTNPTGGGVLYSDGGAGKWRSSGGTTTTFGPAEPHCKVCGRDFVLEWENKKTGHLIVCMWCLTEKLGEEKWITRVN